MLTFTLPKSWDFQYLFLSRTIIILNQNNKSIIIALQTDRSIIIKGKKQIIINITNKHIPTIWTSSFFSCIGALKWCKIKIKIQFHKINPYALNIWNKTIHWGKLTFSYCLYFTILRGSTHVTLCNYGSYGLTLLLTSPFPTSGLFFWSTSGIWSSPTSGIYSTFRRFCEFHFLIKPPIKLLQFRWIVLYRIHWNI